ncbi:MAG: hypothetical protein Q8R96_09760 [Bacteroidota bacterium]|jgi:hypothetical protein|nr:hypothetical protein [Bacteroidota bacterium]
MQEIIIENKQKYLDENYPFVDIPKLSDQKLCIHCDKVIKVVDYKVIQIKSGHEFICCPNAPECNGTVIDWIDID